VSRKLHIIHVFRAPVGGLFRHVRDLVRTQAELGHAVGIICDAKTGGAAAEAALASDRQLCSLGVHRIAIDRLPGLSDVRAAGNVARLCARLQPDVLHGHGAKGGVHVRLAGPRFSIPSVYTPHGGSLHYRWASPKGALFLAAERLLAKRGSGFLFVCDFERDLFAKKIGLGGLPCRVVHNGLWPDEFEPVKALGDATDLLFVGEPRTLKGLGDLLDAIARLTAWRPVTATVVGEGAERGLFEAQAARLRLEGQVTFAGRLSARQAFAKGRLLVIPSHAESFPYIVLEAAAAQMPLIATRVGGIPEILPPGLMVPPRDPQALANVLRNSLERFNETRETMRAFAPDLRRRFDVRTMCAAVVAFYEELVGSKRSNRLTPH
jgi:glycosyltransferase involved in cell wall biosynthesis